MLTQTKLSDYLQKLPDERVAIAFSGGGDSTALVHLCRNLIPKPLVLIVDHALRDGSAKETEQAKDFARSLGLKTRVLKWTHNNPKTGLQEKARRGRYGLMGQVCREEGIHYLLTGHSRNDHAETLFMRYEKNTGWRGAAGMSEKVYAPVWPELARVTILRPLLAASREELRDYNRNHDLGWIEDPSNSNRDFDRIKARDYLGGKPAMARHLLSAAKSLRNGLSAENRFLWANYPIQISKGGTLETDRHVPSRLLGYCLLSASGGGSLAGPAKLKAFRKSVLNSTFKSATLGGALCIAKGDKLVFGRDPSVYKGRHNKAALGTQRLKSHKSLIWDGRFQVTSDQNLEIWPAGEGGADTSKVFVRQFAATLPAWSDESSAHVTTQELVSERLNGFLQTDV